MGAKKRKVRKYALVRDGTVQSVFETNRPLSDFSDIAPHCVEVTGLPDVRDNHKYDEHTQTFSAPASLMVTEGETQPVLQALIAELWRRNLLSAQTALELTQLPRTVPHFVCLPEAQFRELLDLAAQATARRMSFWFRLRQSIHRGMKRLFGPK